MERFEDRRLLRVRNSRAGIGNGYDDVAVGYEAFDPHELPAGCILLHVAEQIAENLLQSIALAANSTAIS